MVEDTIYAGGNLLVYLGAAIQPDSLFRWIQLGLGILLTIVGIAYKIWCWARKAKADGKITKEEIKELIDENKDDVIKVITESTELINEISEISKNNDETER